jgi:hypothetical protein
MGKSASSEDSLLCSKEAAASLYPEADVDCRLVVVMG